jgi:FkbM family methyltransferase
MNAKQWFLGGALGSVLLSTRDRVNLLSLALASNPESIGALANDQLAGVLVTRLSKPNSTFLDIGAHIGSVSASVLRYDASVKVEAIEAIPDKAANLRRKFPVIKVHECAVGDRQGEVQFFVNTRQSGYSSLGRPGGQDANTIKPISVPMRTLDGLAVAGTVDVIKIDIEGAELGALLGGRKLIEQQRPTVMFESAPGDANGLGYTKEAMWQFFEQQGYEIVVPNRLAHNGAGLTQVGFVESHLYPRRCTNYFAIPLERRLELRDRARKVLGIAVTNA